MDINKLKKDAKTLDPILRIGKNGMNDNIILEVEKLLKKRKLIKIKVLNNCSDDKEEIFKTILEKTKSTLVTKIGGTVTIYRYSSKSTKK